MKHPAASAKLKSAERPANRKNDDGGEHQCRNDRGGRSSFPTAYCDGVVIIFDDDSCGRRPGRSGVKNIFCFGKTLTCGAIDDIVRRIGICGGNFLFAIGANDHIFTRLFFYCSNKTSNTERFLAGPFGEWAKKTRKKQKRPLYTGIWVRSSVYPGHAIRELR